MDKPALLHFLIQHIYIKELTYREKNDIITHSKEENQMKDRFIITNIKSVIFIDKHKYPEKKTEFGHDLHFNELIFHFSGQVTVYFNGQILPCGSNTIRFLPTGTTTEYTVDRVELGSCIDVFFETDIPISEKAFVMNCNNTKISELFQKIFIKWVTKDAGYYFECVSLLYKIFAEMQTDRYLPTQKYSNILPAVNYINENFIKSEITSEKISSLCGISYSYVSRLFRQRYGVSPKTYALQMKINYACDLLSSQIYTVSQIADMLGYSDVGFFSRQFKEYKGISPTEFVQKHKSSN